jgi:hemerythrin-like domain-containing protein
LLLASPLHRSLGVRRPVLRKPAEVQRRFGADHRSLERGFDDLAETWARGDVERTRRDLLLTGNDLRRHMRAEDDVLFAAFEAQTGLRDTGPTSVLRREHEQIVLRLDELQQLLGAGDRSSVARRLSLLRALLADHWSREEQIVFTSCDEILETREKLLAVRALGRRKAGRKTPAQ